MDNMLTSYAKGQVPCVSDDVASLCKKVQRV
jgi:hypothetical protein